MSYEKSAIDIKMDDDDTARFIICIIMFGLIGWLAHLVMHTNTGIFLNIILGFVGSIVGDFISYILGVTYENNFTSLAIAFIILVLGTCALIFILRKLGLTL